MREQECPARRRGAHACSNGVTTSQLHTARAIGAVTMMAQDTINIVAVADLAPTQMTVGMREVSFKRRRWRERSSRQGADYLNTLRIPVVLGPNARQYLIDRHHLVLALREEGIAEFTVSFYWITSWIAVIVIAAGIVVWLYFAGPNYDPLGLLISVLGVIIWLGGRAIRYWLADR